MVKQIKRNFLKVTSECVEPYTQFLPLTHPTIHPPTSKSLFLCQQPSGMNLVGNLGKSVFSLGQS